MNTQLITLEVPLVAASQLRSHIEAQLTAYGEPLRWAITGINPAAQTAYIEAVVTQPS